MRLTALTHISTIPDEAGASLLSFRPDSALSHRAGQFGVWFCGGLPRPFTIASAPGDELIQLGTHLHSGSAIKRILSALVPGDRVRLLAPLGNVAPPRDGRPVVFVAQGIGVTVARSLLREPATRGGRLIHVGAPYFRDELAPLVDGAVYPPDRTAFRTDLEDGVRSVPDAHWVISGSTGFAGATVAALRAQGVSSDRLHTDGFIGLPDRDRAPSL